MRMVEEAKEATEQAQDSAQKVEAELQLDDDLHIKEIGKKSLEVSQKIEDESKQLMEKRKKFWYKFPILLPIN